MAKIDLRRLCATILPVNSVVYEITIIWAKIADFRHTIRFMIVSEDYPQKTVLTHGQKQLKKGEKMFYTHAAHGRKYTGKSPRFLHVTQYYDNIQKMLDFCDLLI